jgi:hypothetical protein
MKKTIKIKGTEIDVKEFIAVLKAVAEDFRLIITIEESNG